MICQQQAKTKQYVAQQARGPSATQQALATKIVAVYAMDTGARAYFYHDQYALR
jgi:hypothetical protein